MLNGIKAMINEKKEFTEAADLLLEETSLIGKLDDSIVLGEAVDDEPEEKPEQDEEKKEEPEATGEENDDEGEEPKEVEDIENAPIEDEPVAAGSNENDILNAPIDGSDETPMNLPGDDLPTPVGKQTGEPIEDADILSTEIDLGSNTMKDVLPVPPGNAPEAVNDDVLNQRIDDGFGGGEEPGPSTEENPDNPLGSPTEPIPEPEQKPAEESGSDPEEPLGDDPEFESTLFAGLENLDESTKKTIMDRLKKKNCDDDCKDGKDCKKKCEDHKDSDGDGKCDKCDEKMVEGYITMSDDDEPFTEEILMSGNEKSEEKPAETGTEDTASVEEPTEEPAAEDSPVTAAVKDKVAETEAPLEAETPEGDIKDTLMKKLASMTKSMEDVKLQVSKLAQ